MKSDLSEVLETVQALGQVNLDGSPSNLLDYLRISPLCQELLQVWSKYLIESISVKKNKKIQQNGESTERRVAVGALDCISKVLEYYILVVRIRKDESQQIEEFKDNIEKLGMLILSKYKVNIYRHLSSTSRPLVSSSLRLLASISGLGKSHKQEVMHDFNFSLPSFLSISQLFEYKKRERTDLEVVSLAPETGSSICMMFFDRRSEVSVRIQYLRFIVSLLDLSYSEFSGPQGSDLAEKDVVELFKIRNMGNTIFKNSAQYDHPSISKGLLFAFEDSVLDNHEISSSLKRSFFSLTVINYIFNSFVEILTQIDLKQQVEVLDHGLERYSSIIEKLLRLHIHFKTKEKTRLVFAWFKSINKQIKFPAVQRIMMNIFQELTLLEKMDYFDTCNLQLHIVGEQKLEGILISRFLSNLINTVSHSEKEELKRFIVKNILSKESATDIEAGVRYLAGWIAPPPISRLFSAGFKLFNTSENLFVNISNLAILINVCERLSLATEVIKSSSLESPLRDGGELAITMLKQATYQSFPEFSNILSLLRFYFKSEAPDKEQLHTIRDFFLKRNVYKANLEPNYMVSRSQSARDSSFSVGGLEDDVNGKKDDEDDGMFINIRVSESPSGRDRRTKSRRKEDDCSSTARGPSEAETLRMQEENFKSNLILFNSIKVSIHPSYVRTRQTDDLLYCKLEILEVILAALKSILKGFGNEFLLTMGYKFDNTKLILDQAYRECYLNKEFLANLTTSDYKKLFEDYLYKIILHSLNITGLRYDWNCNKPLLFKFLESLIPIITEYHQNSLKDTKFISNYLTGMWITIVSKLNSSRQNSIFYYLDQPYTSNPADPTANKHDNSSPIPTWSMLSLQLKLVLLVNKTVFNYSIPIKGFFQDYILDGALSGEFLERNMDLIVLLFIISPLDQDQKSQMRELLVNTTGIKGLLGQIKSDLQSSERGRSLELDQIRDYITQVVEKRLVFEILNARSSGPDSNLGLKSVETLLGSVFGSWTRQDQVRCSLLQRMDGSRRLIRGDVTFVQGLCHYYRLVCESGFQPEFDISEIISGLIRASMELLETGERNKVSNRSLILAILDLNYHQLQSHGLSSPEKHAALTAFNTIQVDGSERFIRELFGAICDLYLTEDGERARLLVISFLDIYIRLGIKNDLLFQLMISGDLNLKQVMRSENVEFFNPKLSRYLIHTILNNVSHNELLLITRQLVLNHWVESGMSSKETFLGLPTRVFLSKVLQRIFRLYIGLVEQEHGPAIEWFLSSFVELINFLINQDVLQNYEVQLYSIKTEEIDHDDLFSSQSVIRVPIELFGLDKQISLYHGLVVQTLTYIMTNWLPYVYSKTNSLDIARCTVLGRLDTACMDFSCSSGSLDYGKCLDLLPIGYRLILVFDNLELGSFSLEVGLDHLLESDLSKAIIESTVRSLMDLYCSYAKQSHSHDLDKKSLKKTVKSFSLFSLLCDQDSKSRMKHYIRDGQEILRAQGKNYGFWEMLDMLVLRPETRRPILANSNLIFRFLLDLYSQYKLVLQEGRGVQGGDSRIHEIVYFGFLTHYESFDFQSESPEDGGGAIQTLVECYDALLLRFQSILSEGGSGSVPGQLHHYYYIILMPIIMDRLNNPVYYCLRSHLEELKREAGLREMRYLRFILSYDLNESFYHLLGRIREVSGEGGKFPIGFIESSKAYVGMGKEALDRYDPSGPVDVLLITLLTSTLYIAKIKQLRSFQYKARIYNELGNFVLLKLNRIAVFLNRIHEIIFGFLEDEGAGIDNSSRSLMVLFIFVEYVQMLKESEVPDGSVELGERQGADWTVSREYILDYLKVTKIGGFDPSDSLYGRILSESRGEQTDYREERGCLSRREFRELILVNHNVFLVNSMLARKLIGDMDGGEAKEEDGRSESESTEDRMRKRVRWVKYWYHYYSIYLNNYCVDLENEKVSEFNWLSPSTKRLKHTLSNFPYSCKLVNNSDFNVVTRPGDELVYNLGFVIPIINSRFKLAYSILRERGFQNSKNKVSENDGEEDTRTCSGFIENYSELSGSRFSNKLIDNNFIWLRNFCKNGSLQLVVNSLSCMDVSLRYYSYQTLSLLFEIVSFHYNKYLQRLKLAEEEEEEEEEEEREEEDGREEEEEEMEEEKIEVINKRARNKRKRRRRKVRYIFKELPQIFMILNTLRNTVSGAMGGEKREEGVEGSEGMHEDCIRLSSFLTRFISDSIEIVFEPENPLYRKINYFILSRSFLDRYDIPLLLSFLYSEDTGDYSVQKSFILRELGESVGVLRLLRNTKGQELDQEHDSINRRFIFPLLLNYVKTNNIYSQHDYFENTMSILKTILRMIDNRESNIVYHCLEKRGDDQERSLNGEKKCIRLVGNSIADSNPSLDLLIKGQTVTNNGNKSLESSLPSSVNLLLQMVHQHSLLDFIRNFLSHISGSNYSKLNSKCRREMVKVLVRILQVLTGNIFNSNYNDEEDVFFKIRYFNNESLNKTILRFLGGYSSSYWIFQKLLSCIRLLSNPRISKLFDQTTHSRVRSIWINSYIGLLYCRKYILKDMENSEAFSEIASSYYEYLSNPHKDSMRRL
ncbi:hypothetical protein OJ253_873 [Cryptosporidium canis]|uniref:Uncharacterized protein n=1 Tax=Cryptosporidium canis TaxID=195482 RepID=A0A9D5HVI3_9CRYT|nr:hypothetical protein OJ253_873 [Cryptosporidium canis]